MLANILDYRQIARRALGGTWSTLTREQQQAFLDGFSVLTDRAFTALLAREDTRLRCLSETIVGSDATLVVSAERRRATGTVNRQMECRLTNTQGRWLIHDVLVDGVSLVDTYHDQLGRILQQRGFDALLAQIRQRVQASRPH